MIMIIVTNFSQCRGLKKCYNGGEGQWWCDFRVIDVVL